MLAEIEKTIQILKSGKSILYPTDTVWGLGCDATNETAVKKIFQIKKREESKSLVILVGSIDLLKKHVEEIPTNAIDLINTSSTPLSIIYPTSKNIASNAIASDGSIAIRVTKDPFCKTLIQLFNKPIISTSANISGMPTPSNFAEISTEIKNNVDYIVDWRRDEKTSTLPSKIIKLDSNGGITVIRN